MLLMKDCGSDAPAALLSCVRLCECLSWLPD
jgi:hypothetical protein